MLGIGRLCLLASTSYAIPSYPLSTCSAFLSNPSAFPPPHRQAQVFRYTNDEYEQLLRSESTAAGWTREETDHLMDLCDVYDLRFTVIADRFEVSGVLNNPSPRGPSSRRHPPHGPGLTELVVLHVHGRPPCTHACAGSVL